MKRVTWRMLQGAYEKYAGERGEGRDYGHEFAPDSLSVNPADFRDIHDRYFHRHKQSCMSCEIKRQYEYEHGIRFMGAILVHADDVRAGRVRVMRYGKVVGEEPIYEDT